MHLASTYACNQVAVNLQRYPRSRASLHPNNPNEPAAAVPGKYGSPMEIRPLPVSRRHPVLDLEPLA